MAFNPLLGILKTNFPSDANDQFGVSENIVSAPRSSLKIRANQKPAIIAAMFDSGPLFRLTSWMVWNDTVDGSLCEDPKGINKNCKWVDQEYLRYVSHCQSMKMSNWRKFGPESRLFTGFWGVLSDVKIKILCRPVLARHGAKAAVSMDESKYKQTNGCQFLRVPRGFAPIRDSSPLLP